MTAMRNIDRGTLEAQAANWIERTLPERMWAVGADEREVRRQLEIEASRWVDYNVSQAEKGSDVSPSPDFHLHEVRPELDPTVRTGIHEAPPAWDSES